MRRLVILIVTIVALGLSADDLFAKNSGSRATGTGSRISQPSARGYAKPHIVKGSYNPNTGKRVTKISRK